MLTSVKQTDIKMSAREMNLDRVSLDGLVVRRRSAALRLGAGERPGTSQSPWWVYLACARIPDGYRVGARAVRLDASMIDGREVHADVTIVDRLDDAYGTTLILAGLDPLPNEAA